MNFYNSKGKPIAYICDDGEHIYLFNGKPVAYLSENIVYGFNGYHLGWFEDGWVRDKRGKCVFFTENANGGPVKPIKQIAPIKGIKHIKPVKGVKHIASVKSVDSLSWSELSVEQFFEQ